MDIEEIYDKIGSNYHYTYLEFLEQVTPKLASRLIDIISIREHNDYWYAASLHGVNVKDKIIRPRMKVEPVEPTQEQKDLTKQYLANLAKRRKNGER
jgi:hypothetical protein